jgi:uncharacterized membrane protein YGL010W
MALFSTRSWEDWIAEYERGHQHPVNRLCHTFGIPLVASSLGLLPVSLLVPGSWRFALALFVCGWTLQLVGHAFERAPPEFLKDWRFLFVSLGWFMKSLVRGRAGSAPPSQ